MAEHVVDDLVFRHYFFMSSKYFVIIYFTLFFLVPCDEWLEEKMMKTVAAPAGIRGWESGVVPRNVLRLYCIHNLMYRTTAFYLYVVCDKNDFMMSVCLSALTTVRRNAILSLE